MYLLTNNLYQYGLMDIYYLYFGYMLLFLFF